MRSCRGDCDSEHLLCLYDCDRNDYACRSQCNREQDACVKLCDGEGNVFLSRLGSKVCSAAKLLAEFQN